jgi:hypothetical protein
MWGTIACLIGILGLLWVALSRYRDGDRKAALFWLSVAVIATIALIAINTLTVRWLGHPPQNSSTTIALSERRGLAAFAEAPTYNAERHLPSLSAEPVAFRFPYCVKPEL